MILIYKNILKFISNRRKLQLGILTLLTLSSSFFEIFSIGAIFPFVSVFVDPSLIFENEYIKPLLNYFKISRPSEIYLPITIGFLTLSTISYLLKVLLIYFRNEICRKINQELSSLMYWKIINEDYQFYTDQNTGDVITGLIQSSKIVNKFLLPSLKMMNASLMLAFALTGIIMINPLISLIIIVGVSFFYFIISILVNSRLKNYSNIQNINYSQLIKLIQESLGAIKMVLLNSTQRVFFKSYDRLNGEYFKTISDIEFISSIPKIVFEYMITIVIVLIMFNVQSKEDIATFVPLIITFVLFIQKILPEISVLYRGSISIKSEKEIIKRILSYLNINLKSPHTNLAQHTSINFKKSIRLEELSFKYGKKEKQVLSNINLSINKGQIIGIAGESGSGKSTLIDIISGLIEPNLGEIFIDDLKLDYSNINGWKEKINVVSQNIFLFDSTIEENIAFNSYDSKINYKKLNQVCRIAQLTTFIENLQEGYQSRIGEKGAKISGGQIQRIAIARALYNSSEILILDEATSALDQDTELKVMNNIINNLKGITLIIIAHRLSTLNNCDVIYKVETKGLLKFDTYDSFIKNINHEI